jgi:hypothetical protein
MRFCRAIHGIWYVFLGTILVRNFKNIFWILRYFWIDAGSWCLKKTVSSPSWFCKCFEAPYKTAKILSVKGSMNKSLQFCKSSSEWDITKSKGRYPSNQSYGEFFIIIVRFAIVALRNLQFQYLLCSKEMWYLNGITLIKSNVLYWSTFRLKNL